MRKHLRLMTNKKFNSIFYLIIIICFISSISHAQPSIQGKVISIADGDTITILQNSKQYKIRLHGIDTPEKKQNFGQKAKRFTSSMVFNRYVKVISYGTDKYGRTIGMVYIDQKCLNKELIKNGYAWVYKKYCSEYFCNEWLQLEKNARKNKLGLWVDNDPVPPWNFRRGKSENFVYNILSGFHGNLSSHVFHRAGCKYFNCKNCTKAFRDRDAAIKSGYKPCGLCNP